MARASTHTFRPAPLTALPNLNKHESSVAFRPQPRPLADSCKTLVPVHRAMHNPAKCIGCAKGRSASTQA